MSQITKILLAEDDMKLGNATRESFVNVGFEVDLACDGGVAERFFRSNVYDIILLDVNMPIKNGLELCKIFRLENKKVPIIMITALGELDDKIDAFELGADDYLVKPFHIAELMARIKVFLKRKTNDEQPKQPDAPIVVGDLEIQQSNKRVYRAGNEIKLTQKEYLLLELLAMNRGRVVSKVDIAEKVWDIGFDTGTNTIEVYINFLRNKVDKPYSKKMIFTKTGFGYYLDVVI
jgi:DNA-binding response OmpR family regulator